MDSFLEASKACLDNLVRYKIVRVVLGNPTCDLDSAVCALVYAFHRYNDVKDKGEDIAVIPLLNIPEKEFRLKTEVLYHFEKHSIPLELLTFRDQLSLEVLSSEKKLEIILVDHHTLSEESQGLANSVVEIIDHRPQDPAWLWPQKEIKIKIVGSCSTLIAKILIDKKSKILEPRICSFLRGPILVDTVNFSVEANRATPDDAEVIKKLEEIGFITSDREMEYKELLFAKTDISRLTPGELLIRDLKVANGIPISGLPILVESFVKLDGAFEALTEFTTEYSCSVTVVMGLDLKNDTVTRDIAIFSPTNNKLRSTIIESLKSNTEPSLNLMEEQMISTRNKYDLVLFKQGNVQASRKQILPIIRSISINCNSS